MSKIKPGDKLIIYGPQKDSKPFLAEMVDYDPNYNSYLVLRESDVSEEVEEAEVPKLTFSDYENIPEELESFITTEVLKTNPKLEKSFWVDSKLVRKIQMEPLSGIQKFIAKLFDI